MEHKYDFDKTGKDTVEQGTTTSDSDTFTSKFSLQLLYKEQSCLNSCSNNGECTSEGTCKCFDGFIGQDCSIESTELPLNKYNLMKT